jgi:hypothetical protein
MKSFIVGYSRAKSPWKIGSTVIQEVEKRNFGHVYIRYTCLLTGIEVVAQASHGYVNEMNYDIFQEQNVVVREYEVICSDEDFINMLKFIRTNLGRDYDQLAILIIGLKKIFGIKIQANNRDKHFICSEFGARVCQIVKLPLDVLNLDYFTPSQSELFMSNLTITHSDIVKRRL